MKTFLELLEQSVIVQGLITLITLGVIAYLYIANRAVPQELWALMSLIVGFYFGSKTNYQVNRTIRSLKDKDI